MLFEHIQQQLPFAQFHTHNHKQSVKQLYTQEQQVQFPH